jgi:hypothetical protein
MYISNIQATDVSASTSPTQDTSKGHKKTANKALLNTAYDAYVNAT